MKLGVLRFRVRDWLHSRDQWVKWLSGLVLCSCILSFAIFSFRIFEHIIYKAWEHILLLTWEVRSLYWLPQDLLPWCFASSIFSVAPHLLYPRWHLSFCSLHSHSLQHRPGGYSQWGSDNVFLPLSDLTHHTSVQWFLTGAVVPLRTLGSVWRYRWCAQLQDGDATGIFV